MFSSEGLFLEIFTDIYMCRIMGDLSMDALKISVKWSPQNGVMPICKLYKNILGPAM